MRRLVICIALGLLALPMPAKATVIVAHCDGVATISVVPPKAGGSCTTTFTLGGVTRIWLGFEPADDFTGSIQASVTQPGGGVAIKALYYSGGIIAGQPIEFFDIGGGTWKLSVIAGAAPPGIPCVPPNPATAQCPINTFAAIGGFGGSVSA